MLRRQVKDLLAKVWSIDASNIPDEVSLNQFEKWDSLGHISIVLALEERFGIPVNEETVQSLDSLSAIMAYLERTGRT